MKMKLAVGIALIIFLILLINIIAIGWIMKNNSLKSTTNKNLNNQVSTIVKKEDSPTVSPSVINKDDDNSNNDENSENNPAGSGSSLSTTVAPTPTPTPTPQPSIVPVNNPSVISRAS